MPTNGTRIVWKGKPRAIGGLIQHAEQERRMRIARTARCSGDRYVLAVVVRIEVEVHQVRKDSDADVIPVLRPELQVMRPARLRHLAAERVVMRMLDTNSCPCRSLRCV